MKEARIPSLLSPIARGLAFLNERLHSILTTGKATAQPYLYAGIDQIRKIVTPNEKGMAFSGNSPLK